MTTSLQELKRLMAEAIGDLRAAPTWQVFPRDFALYQSEIADKLATINLDAIAAKIDAYDKIMALPVVTVDALQWSRLNPKNNHLCLMGFDSETAKSMDSWDRVRIVPVADAELSGPKKEGE